MNYLNESFNEIAKIINASVEDIKEDRFSDAEKNLSHLDRFIPLLARAALYKAYALQKVGEIEKSKDLAALSAAMDGECLQRGQILGLNFDRYLGKVENFSEGGDISAPGANRDKSIDFWPDNISILNISDFRRIVSENILIGDKYNQRFLSKRRPVATLGSCFATNIGRSLSALGFNVNNNAFNDEATNSYAIRYFSEWAAYGDNNKFTNYFEKTYGSDARRAARDTIEKAQAVILTFGVAPCLFHDGHGEFAFTSKKNDKVGFDYLPGNYLLRTTSVEENTSNINAVCDAIRSINKNCKIVLTVSPVPLAGTNEMKSAVIADCISKSTIRLAVHEAANQVENCIYWPSFEMIRWLGGHSEFAMFGGDDGLSRHVNRNVVDAIVDLFANRFILDEG